MALPIGMAENPCESYSLQSRLVCAKCWIEPTIINPDKIGNGEMLSITVECHGERETKTIKKSDLVFTQQFFTPET